jgi:hypothetical protein
VWREFGVSCAPIASPANVRDNFRRKQRARDGRQPSSPPVVDTWERVKQSEPTCRVLWLMKINREQPAEKKRPPLAGATFEDEADLAKRFIGRLICQ